MSRQPAPRITTCPLCEAMCGLLVEVDGRRIRSVRGDPDDPFSRGYVCPKAAALADLHHDPERIRTPLIRTGSDWREASWDEALDRAAGGLAGVRRRHGRDAVGLYYGNPVAHNLGLLTHGLAFRRAFGTRNVYSASSADQLPQMLAALRMFGHFGLIPVPDVDRTDFFLVIGANPLVSNGSLMSAPDMRRRLAGIRARGGRVVVVDPRRTETADAADTHLAIRPGADALLLAALLQVIFAQGRVRLGRLAGRVNGIDALAALVGDLTPERVAPRTGIAPAAIRRLAVDFAHAERAACYGRVGLCTQRHGTLAAWLQQALNLATGRLDEVGGMLLPTPAVDVLGILARLGWRGTFDRWRSGARNLPEFGGELPVAGLADEIEHAGPRSVRALLTVAGNPVLSAPNGRRLERALGTLEHMVAVDLYLNETTRHAHVLLPPAPPLARPHYDLALNAFAVRNVAKYAEPAVPGSPAQRHDWEILAELGGRALAPRPLRRLVTRAARALRPERVLDLLLRLGPHDLTLARLRATPHGVDLGPLQPGRLAGRVATPDGRIDIAPEAFVREARNRLLPEADGDGASGLVLIGRRQSRSNNSWMHNSRRLVKGPARCTLLVHPEDAEARRLLTGDLAEIGSAAGSVTVPVEVTDSMRPGVVSLPHGWGHDREGSRLGVARAHAGASANDVTSELHLDTLSGNAAFNGLPVTVRRRP
ncbi:MAG: molybdopterin-dependent oxidoreductase [Acidobacteria bacterium]|nr:molybdopterin-dependent oxidoreductase [Acidobacteriota bacterium]